MPLVTVLPDSFSAWGLSSHSAGEKHPFASHYHDCDEWYFIVEGRLTVRSEGVVYEMVKDDVLLTAMGDEHEIIEVFEDTKLFWLEGPLQGQKRRGHLHR